MKGARNPVALLRFVLLKHRATAINLKSLGVLPDHRRSGLASALMYSGYKTAFDRGYRRVNLCLILDGNPSGDGSGDDFDGPFNDEDGVLLGVVERSAVDDATIDHAESDHMKSLGIASGEELRSMPTLRRLQLAAEAGESWGVLFRTERTARESSPRWPSSTGSSVRGLKPSTTRWGGRLMISTPDCVRRWTTCSRWTFLPVRSRSSSGPSSSRSADSWAASPPGSFNCRRCVPAAWRPGPPGVRGIRTCSASCSSWGRACSRSGSSPPSSRAAV